jgi:hypothetical protein
MEESVRVHCRFGMLLGLVWLVAVQSAQALAMEPTLSETSATTGAPGYLTAAGVRPLISLSSVADASIPEPGIVALLGFGLVLLGLSYRRTDGRADRTHRLRTYDGGFESLRSGVAKAGRRFGGT